MKRPLPASLAIAALSEDLDPASWPTGRRTADELRWIVRRPVVRRPTPES